MALTKNFLHKNADSIKISRLKLTIGILLGCCFAFTFYAFLCLIRDAFRILSVIEPYCFWVLTDKEIDFYNLIFAFISVIMGQSVAFHFWFNRPEKIFEKGNYRKTAILNSQSALNWYFLSWLSKLAFLFGALFGLTFRGGFNAFSFYPDYNYIFILIIIVLFLQTWSAANFHFKRNGQKYMFISGVLLSIIAFGFSRINLIDYTAIDQNYLQYNYRLDLPETESYKHLRKSRTTPIYITEASTNNVPVIFADNKKIPIEKLHEKIEEWQHMTDGGSIDYSLHIHQSIKMDFIHQVKNELSKSGVSNISYAVVPTTHKYDKMSYSFPIVLPNWTVDELAFKEMYKSLNTIRNIIEIKHAASNYSINDSLVQPNQIKSVVKRLIEKDNDYIVKFYVNDSVAFSDYFKVLSGVKEAVDELRNEYALEKYSKHADLLHQEEYLELKRQYPFRILEITTGVFIKVCQ